MDGFMRNSAPFVLLLSTLCWGQSSTGESSVNVHVTSSQWLMVPLSTGASGDRKLNVIINGKKYELEAPAKRTRLLALGDYKAKLIEDVHKNSYESTQTYELQFSDGKNEEVHSGRSNRITRSTLCIAEYE